MKFKFALGAAAVFLLIGLGMALAGAVSGRFDFDLSAGRGTVLRAEGEKTIADAKAAAIAADTARTNANAMQALTTKKQTDVQWVAMLGKWTTAGSWAGGGLMIIGVFIIVYYFGHGAWISNDRRRRSPIIKRVGPITVTVLTGGITTWQDDNVPGWTVHCNMKGEFGATGPTGDVLIGVANARAMMNALQNLGYSPQQAVKAYADFRQASNMNQPAYIEAAPMETVSND